MTSDVIYPGAMSAQIISADIGEAPGRSSIIPTKKVLVQHRNTMAHLTLTPQVWTESRSPKQLREPTPPQLSIAELKVTLRRLSKIVLAGYGGASLLFFGISPTAVSSMSAASPTTATAAELASEEVRLTHAVDASEAEAAGEEINQSINTVDSSENRNFESPSSYAWWDILLGKHDKEILERSVELENENHDDFQSEREKDRAKMKEKMKATIVSPIIDVRKQSYETR